MEKLKNLNFSGKEKNNVTGILQTCQNWINMGERDLEK